MDLKSLDDFVEGEGEAEQTEKSNTDTEAGKYKDTPIGKIPKEWDVVNLKEISSNMYYGVTAKATEENTGLRMLRTTDIKGYQVDWSKLPFCKITENRNNFDKYFIKRDDLIVARAGTAGVSILVEKDFKEIVFGSYLIKIRLKNSVFPKFAHLFFQSEIYWKHIKSTQAGSTLRNINLQILQSLKIPLPPLIEQQKIAQILSTVDNTIQKVDNAIARTERLKKGLMQELLTKGIGHEEFKDTEIGRIPKEWDVVNLEEILEDIRYGTSKKSNNDKQGYPVIGIPNILHGKIDEGNLRYTVLPNTEKQLALNEGDILLVRTNANPDYIGRCALFKNLRGTWVYASYLIRIRIDEDRADPGYLVKLLQSEKARRQFLSIARTSAGNYNINTTGIKSIVVCLPEISEQQKIAEVLSTVDKKLELERKRKQKLERIKKGLMNDLLTGKKRVKVS